MSNYMPENPELIVPAHIDTRGRIAGFYSEIDWDVEVLEEDRYRVAPLAPSSQESNPAIDYRISSKPDEIIEFGDTGPRYSDHSVGKRLPVLRNQADVTLTLPGDEAVRRVYWRGSILLARHLITPPVTDANGRCEFWIADPFGYSLRITTF